ncbi:MAG: DNA mismatch repair protein MutS, partial [Clostridia bacterium]|nr:DNA mismatch repair protein MutS [Clostridia bacterium]
MAELSPMMKQYLLTKEKHKDCIVFYRLGDFYEMFFDDAIKASELLDLTLTGRDCGLDERAPMCGVPFHAADEYIAKLVSLGEKVAVCEQLTEPTKGGKDLVQRDVVKIVSAGTITNDDLIDNKQNNFLACVYLDDNQASMAWADITTGEFFTKCFKSEKFLSELSNELIKISPAEIISNNKASEFFNQSPIVVHNILPKFTYFTQSEFDYSIAEQTIKSQFGLHKLSSLGLKENSCVINSCGALIAYLKETQKHALLNLKSIKVEEQADFMMLDANAIRNLELVKTIHDGKRYGSLLWLLDKTRTGMGARKLQSWILSPLNDKSKIEYRLNGVESLYNNTLIRQSISQILGSVKDIGRLAGKISNGNLMPADCLALKNSLEVLPSIKFQLLGIESDFIRDIDEKLEDFSDVIKLISCAISDNPKATTKDGGYIKDGYNQNLDELRSISKNSKVYLSNLENEEREKTGIKTLRIAYNRVFGYYIEVTNSFKDKIPY